ncbi:protein of unknown function [Blastococcus fimeti]|nr:protein of unknown function [Blastococcus fimeti]
MVSELLSALDELAGIDLDELSPDGLLDLVAGLVTATNRMTAAVTRAVRAADRREAYDRDGAVSMKAWLRGSCRMDPAEATATVSTGRRLEQLPATAAAFADGAISAAHARSSPRP